MADKKKGRQRKLEEIPPVVPEPESSEPETEEKEPEEKPTKEEYAVAKYLRFNLPVREGKLHGMEVKCFFGNAAVDKLLESKWSATKNKKDPLFTNRVSCVSYLVRLLEKGLFHRAEREKRKKDKDKDKSKKKRKDKEEETAPAEEDLRKRKGKKERVKKDKEGETTADDEGDKKAEAEKKEEKKDDKKKKEKRLKLVMPEQQFFEDGDEVYVWIYDPVNAKTFLIGLLMVLGAIALCMFPLWPDEVKIGVYYLSLSGAGFVGFILLLVVVRLILFCCIWVITFGKHHFWFLPNLTEDVGFFDSFRPLYKHDYFAKTDEGKSSDSGKKKKRKDKDKEEKEEKAAIEVKKEKSSDKDDSDEFEVIKQEDLERNGDTNGDNEEDDGEAGDDIENDYDDNETGDNELDEEDEDNNGDENGDSEDEDDEDEDDEEDEDQSAKRGKSEGKKKK